MLVIPTKFIGSHKEKDMKVGERLVREVEEDLGNGKSGEGNEWGIKMITIRDSHLWKCNNQHYCHIESIYGNRIRSKKCPLRKEENQGPKPWKVTHSHNPNPQALNESIIVNLRPRWATAWDHVRKKNHDQSMKKKGCQFNQWRMRKKSFHCRLDILSLDWLRIYKVRLQRQLKIQPKAGNTFLVPVLAGIKGGSLWVQSQQKAKTIGEIQFWLVHKDIRHFITLKS